MIVEFKKAEEIEDIRHTVVLHPNLTMSSKTTAHHKINDRKKIHLTSLTLILPFLSRSKILFTESLTRHSFQLLPVRNHNTISLKQP